MPSAPKSVEVDTVAGRPSHLLVTWQPPETPNGLITNYKVFCFDSSSDIGSGTKQDTSEYQASISNETVLASEMSASVGGLDPYMIYSCIVVAYTSIGKGEPSSTVSGVTDQSCKVDQYFHHCMLIAIVCCLYYISQHLEVLLLTSH